MPYQQLQLRIERENLAQLGNRLGWIDAVAEIPGLLDRAVEQIVGAVRPPVQLARGEVDGGAGQRPGQRFAGGIVEMVEARSRRSARRACGSPPGRSPSMQRPCRQAASWPRCRPSP